MTITESITRDIDIVVSNAKKLAADYSSEQQKHQRNLDDIQLKATSAKDSINSSANTRINDAKQACDAEITLLQLKKVGADSLLSDLEKFYPRKKIDFSTFAGQAGNYRPEEALKQLEKIKETGFWAWIKKLFNIAGYKSNHDMAADLYLTIDSALAYIEQEIKKENSIFSSKSSQIKSDAARRCADIDRTYRDNVSRENSRYQSRLKFLEQQKRAYLSDPHYRSIEDLRSKAFDSLAGTNDGWLSFMASKTLPAEILIGQVLYPCGIVNPSPIEKDVLKKAICYVEKMNAFSIPFSKSLSVPMLLYYETESSSAPAADIFRHIVMRQVRFMPPKSFRAFFIDPVNRGRSLGSLIHLTEKDKGCGVCDYSLSNQEIADRMKKLTEHVDEVCRKLTSIGCDNINEYNARVNKNRIAYTTLVIHDFPIGFDSQSIDALRVVISQAKQCGISILISKKKTDKLENAALQLVQNNIAAFTTFAEKDGKHSVVYGTDSIRFKPQEIQASERFFAEVNKRYAYKPPIDNSFSKYFIPGSLPSKRSSEKGLDVPFAVDSHGQLVELKIGYDLSAYGFINGGVGSGKTTLLHTIITSAIMHYSPRELELWLVDYKIAEFAFYTNHCPPHIKYIVADKSNELTYSVIENIEEEIDRRERLFVKSQVKDYEHYREKQLTQPSLQDLPKVLIIVDEFHRMSQAAQADTLYKEKLENIFKEARSHGIILLLCDQSFDGLRGLSDEARKLIAVRIAMRHDVSEIREILNIPSGAMDEDLQRLIRETSSGVAGSLIYKHEVANDKDSFSNKVVYDPCRALYAKEDERITAIEAVCQDAPVSIREPEFFMGSKRYPFDKKAISAFEALKPIRSDEGDRFYIGSPMGMGQCHYFRLTHGSGENLILAGNNEEMRFALLKSMIRCALRYAYKIVILVPRSAPLYKKNKEFFEGISGAEVYTGFPEICKYIGETANLLKQQSEEDDFEDEENESASPNTIVFCINPWDIYEKMDASTLKQKDAWAIAPVKAPEKAVERKPIVTDDKIVEIPKETPAEHQSVKKSTETSLDESALSGMLENLDSLLQSLDQQIGGIQDSFAGDEGQKIRGYNATSDFGILISKGHRDNIHSFLILDNAMPIKKMREIKLDGNFNHRIALSMSPDEASSFMGHTRVMTAINDSGDLDCAVYEYKGGREQCFRPYLA